MEDTAPKKPAMGLASFAIPRAAIDALINAQADAVTIGAYLTLACHTDKSGQFSTVGLHAIRENLAVNRDRAEKAIHRLCTIRSTVTVPAEIPTPIQRPKRPRSKLTFAKPHAPIVPLIYTRDAWLQANGGALHDGPNDRAKVRYVLPTFDEPLEKRVWIGSGLVRGDDVFDKPLRQLKNCGDVAARLLLAMYAGQDLDRWYGVPPQEFPWESYMVEEVLHRQFRLLSASKGSKVGPSALFARIDQREKNSQTCFDALAALESAGFLYEAVVLLNRNPIPAKFVGGTAYGDIPNDAEILSDLGSPSPFGPVLEIERGLADDYLATAKELNWIVQSCNYLVIIPTGHPAMICGLYRLRFRVTHFKNAFIKEATIRYLDANATALRMLNYLRKTKNLNPINRTLQYCSISLQSSSMPFNASQSKNIRGEDN